MVLLDGWPLEALVAAFSLDLRMGDVMKAYTPADHKRCCPGHDPGSKKFDRANRKRRVVNTSRANALRSYKKTVRRTAKNEIKKEDE